MKTYHSTVLLPWNHTTNNGKNNVTSLGVILKMIYSFVVFSTVCVAVTDFTLDILRAQHPILHKSTCGDPRINGMHSVPYIIMTTTGEIFIEYILPDGYIL